MSQWLLVETFGSAPPSVIGVGKSPKNLVPLDRLLRRGPSLSAVENAVAQVCAARGEVELPVPAAGHRRVIGIPLLSFRSHVHGVAVWTGQYGEDPPPREVAGAWHFNLTTDVIGGSDDLLDLYGVATELRKHKRYTAEAFSRLVPNVDVAAAFAMLVRSKPGDEHQAVWTVIRDDGQHRAGHLSCRAVPERNEHGDQEVVLRGITHDIGPAERVPVAPPPVILEQRLLQSMSEPGVYRAIANVKTFRIIRWIDGPMPGLGWELDDKNPLPWVHEDDLPAAQALMTGLATASKTTGAVRLRGHDRSWQRVAVTANLVLLDQNTTAALLTLTGLS